MLKARMANQWSKFFLYINLEELYINNALKGGPNRDQFNRLSEADKRMKIDAYKKRIMDYRVEGDLIILPHSFKIMETNYTPFRATVTVEQVYQHPDYSELRTYKYSLKRSDNNVWEITDYEVTNKNTGKR
jgi:hypothetical protein